MKRQIGFKMALVALILALTAMPGLAQEVPETADTVAASGGFVWRTATVDSSGDRGSHTSIAFSSPGGIPWISYYDEGNGDLRVAHRVSSGGNCGPNNEWKCETVDSSGDVGQNSSIDVYIDPAILHSLRVGVAYQDVTHLTLKFAEYSCMGLPPICSWSAATIDQGDAMGPGYGRYTSIKYDADGRPHIAYYVVRWEGDLVVNDLRFAYRRDTGTGNCGPGNYWTCYAVNSNSGSGRYQYVSMEMTYAGSTLIPYIAYYDGIEGDLMLARYVGGSGGSGCTQSSWSCQTIDGASADVGQSASLRLDNVGGVRIAYYDATHGKLKYAYQVYTGLGNCGGGNFHCITIEDAAPPADARSISLAVNGADYPLIAYRQVALPFSQLRVAQPIDALGLSEGNCGPFNVHLKPTWQCLTVDTAATLFSVADHVSTAFDPDDLPMVAYSELFHNPIGGGSNYDLKIAYGRRGALLPLVPKNYP